MKNKIEFVINQKGALVFLVLYMAHSVWIATMLTMGVLVTALALAALFIMMVLERREIIEEKDE